MLWSYAIHTHLAEPQPLRALEVDDIEKAVAFYEDVFDLDKLDEREGYVRTCSGRKPIPMSRAGTRGKNGR